MKFRKKPIVIEAVQWNGRTEDLMAFGDLPIPIVLAPLPAITIQTLEGDMLCSPGDWIIQGVAGEFYPCKPDIFKATYEPA
jgi:hypothetical protein